MEKQKNKEAEHEVRWVPRGMKKREGGEGLGVWGVRMQRDMLTMGITEEEKTKKAERSITDVSGFLLSSFVRSFVPSTLARLSCNLLSLLVLAPPCLYLYAGRAASRDELEALQSFSLLGTRLSHAFPIPSPGSLAVGSSNRRARNGMEWMVDS